MSKHDSAADTGLPADSPPSRRAILTAVPVAAIGIGALKGSLPPTPTALPDAADDGLASLEDFANAEFAGIEPVDALEAREAFNRNWTPLALAVKCLEKDHNGLLDFVAVLEGNEASDLLCVLGEGREYFKICVELIDKATARLLSASARHAKAMETLDV